MPSLIMWQCQTAFDSAQAHKEAAPSPPSGGSNFKAFRKQALAGPEQQQQQHPAWGYAEQPAPSSMHVDSEAFLR